MAETTRNPYGIKKLKTWNGRDGGGFSCDLFKDGTKIGDAINEGSGGCTSIHFLSRELREEFEAFVAVQPDKVYPADAHSEELVCKADDDSVISDLVDDELEARWLKRTMKKYTVISLPDEPKGKYITFKAAFSPEVKAQVLKKYPDAIFANEQISNA